MKTTVSVARIRISKQSVLWYKMEPFLIQEGRKTVVSGSISGMIAFSASCNESGSALMGLAF